MKQIPLLSAVLLTACASVGDPATSLDAFAGSVPATDAVATFAYEQDPAPETSATVEETDANRLSLYLGRRSLDKGEWAPLEDQPVFMVEFAHEPEGSAIGWEIGLGGSADSDKVLGADVDVTVGELYGGVVKSFLPGDSVVRPYLGGGVSYLTADVDVPGGGDDDSSLAAYLHGGAAFNVTQSFYLGVDLRVLFGSDITLGGIGTDADYEQFTVFLGFGF